jgi:hypothetical protein
MDRLRNDTSERKRWPPVSIVQKRVDPLLFNNAHNAHVTTRITLSKSSSGAGARLRKVTAKNPKHYNRRQEPVESRILSNGKSTNPVHHSWPWLLPRSSHQPQIV